MNEKEVKQLYKFIKHLKQNLLRENLSFENRIKFSLILNYSIETFCQPENQTKDNAL